MADSDKPKDTRQDFEVVSDPPAVDAPATPPKPAAAATSSPAPRVAAPGDPDERILPPGLGTLLQRSLQSDLSAVEALSDEVEALEGRARPITHEAAVRYVVWRRSHLWMGVVVGVIACLGGLIKFIETVGMEIPQPGNGIEIRISPLYFLIYFVLQMSPAILVVAMFLAARKWASPEKTRRLVAWGTLAAIVVPISTFLLPLGSLISVGDPLSRFTPEQITQFKQGAFMLLSLFAGLTAFMLALPRILAIMPAFARAAVTLKTLTPGRSLPGVAAVLGGLIGAGFTIALFVQFIQIVGSVLFAVAVVLFVASPAATGWMARRLIPPMDQATVIAEGRRLRMTALGLQTAAFILGIVALAEKKFNGMHWIGVGGDDVMFGILDMIPMIAGYWLMKTGYMIVATDLGIEAMQRAGVLSKGYVETAAWKAEGPRVQALADALAVDVHEAPSKE